MKPIQTIAILSITAALAWGCVIHTRTVQKRTDAAQYNQLRVINDEKIAALKFELEKEIDESYNRSEDHKAALEAVVKAKP